MYVNVYVLIKLFGSFYSKDDDVHRILAFDR